MEDEVKTCCSCLSRHVCRRLDKVQEAIESFDAEGKAAVLQAMAKGCKEDYGKDKRW